MRSLCLATAVLIVLASFAPTAAAEPIAVVDHRGKVIQIDAPVAHLAIFPLPIPEAVIAIDGGTQRLAGINPLARSTLLNGVIGQLFPEIARIDTTLVSRDLVPNVEELVRAKPDVVVQWDTGPIGTSPTRHWTPSVSRPSPSDRSQCCQVASSNWC